MKDVDGQEFFRVFESVAKRIKVVRRTGNSLTVTIPHPIVKHLKLKEGDRVFFYPISEEEAGIRRNVNNVREFILEEIERMQKARELMSRLGEELGKGNISIMDELKHIKKELKTMSRMLARIHDELFPEFMISIPYEDLLLMEIAGEIEMERDDEFKGVIESIKKFKQRRELLREAVENLKEWIESGFIKKEDGERLLNMVQNELKFENQRLKILEDILKF